LEVLKNTNSGDFPVRAFLMVVDFFLIFLTSFAVSLKRFDRTVKIIIWNNYLKISDGVKT